MIQRNQDLERIIGWHLEITRRCALECPACPRTFEREGIPDLNQDLSYEDILNFFRKDQLKYLKYIFLQGNLGDPIYHPKFHEIAEHFFGAQHLAISTNGMKTKKFWERVIQTWPENSLVMLSIDGLEDTNHLYRVKSRWNLIEELFDVIATTKRKCKIEWKYILFEHNHQDVEKAHELSKKLGIDSFRLQKTRPLTELTNKGGFLKEFDGNYFNSDEKKKPLDELAPFCKTLDMHYVDATGAYFPCCWWPSHYKDEGNEAWEEKRIQSFNLEEAYSHFKKFTQCLSDYEKAPEVCRTFCSKFAENTEELLTPNSQLNRKYLGNSKKEWEIKKD